MAERAGDPGADPLRREPQLPRAGEGKEAGARGPGQRLGLCRRGVKAPPGHPASPAAPGFPGDGSAPRDGRHQGSDGGVGARGCSLHPRVSFPRDGDHGARAIDLGQLLSPFG